MVKNVFKGALNLKPLSPGQEMEFSFQCHYRFNTTVHFLCIARYFSFKVRSTDSLAVSGMD